MTIRNISTRSGRSEEKPLSSNYHFQWQNPILLKSIYPARERKLMEFLLVFDEIDITKEYQHKPIEAVIQEYRTLPTTLPNAMEGEPTDEASKKLALGQWHIDKFNDVMQMQVNTEQVLNSTDARLVRRAVMFFKMVEKFNKYKDLEQNGLLELVVQRFHREPNIYPEWLIYMVIHFSGMRYQSAHASYHDPKKLLAILNVEGNNLNDEQALVELEKIKNEREQAGIPIPDWAWHEIVRLTPLRLKYAQENWEERQTPGNSLEDHRWVQFFSEWKKDMTEWKKKHQDTLSLIVTRAVCNEISEHVQHMRGLVTSAGISRTTDWYNKQKTPGAYFRHQDSEADFQPGAAIFWMGWELHPPGDHEVVRKLSNVDLTGHISPEKLKVGTPVFKNEWATWFHNNMFIRTRQLKPTQDDKKQRNQLKKDINDNTQRNKNLRNRLGRLKEKDILQRRQIEAEMKNRTRSIEKNERQIELIEQKSKPTKLYLHWPHEAIVVNVEQLITGRKTITFETADGTMGINERPNMLLGGREQDVFIGYHPPKELSAEMDQKLVEMIRWDKILQNPDYPTRVRPSLGAGEEGVDLTGEAENLFSIMVTAKNGVNLKGGRVLKRGTIFQGVVREQGGVKTYQVSACEDEDSAKGAVLKEEEASPLEQCFWVEVSQATDCKTIKGSNKKGFPIFRRFRPKTNLPSGMRLLVSANHKINQSDLNGRIQGNGMTFWYLILPQQEVPEAAGLYVSAKDIAPLSKPASWDEIQAQIKAGKIPGEVEEAGEELAALEEELMVINPAGIELGEGKVIARGKKLLCRQRISAGVKSYRITNSGSETGVVGQVIKGEDLSQLKSGFWVEISIEADAKFIKGRNNKDIPLFGGTQPKTKLKPGGQLVVSATHQENTSDRGGRVQGDGRVFWYLILEHPELPEAAGLFIPAEAVKLLSTPATWPELQAQVKSGQFPSALEDDELIGGGEEPPEERVMVISNEGIELDKETVMPRGTICFANLRDANDEISYRITSCEDFQDARGKVLTENQASLLDKCFWAKTTSIAFCKAISDWNNKGFPIFRQKKDPVIRLPLDKPFLVSASHEFNDTDVNGAIRGDGNDLCYLILEHPDVPEAAGLYVQANAILQQTELEEWDDIHKKVKAVVSSKRKKVLPL